MIRSVAMEFLEAKNPLVVEKSPMRIKAKVGKLISGDKKTLSTVVLQEKTGLKAVAMFGKKLLASKSLTKSNSIIISGRLWMPMPRTMKPLISRIPVIAIGILGRFLMMNLRCG